MMVACRLEFVSKEKEVGEQGSHRGRRLFHHEGHEEHEG